MGRMSDRSRWSAHASTSHATHHTCTCTHNTHWHSHRIDGSLGARLMCVCVCVRVCVCVCVGRNGKDERSIAMECAREHFTRNTSHMYMHTQHTLALTSHRWLARCSLDVCVCVCACVCVCVCRKEWEG